MGFGAALCAVLALVGLNIVNIVLLLGLACAVFGFLGSAGRRARRLGYAGWGLAAWLLFLTVFSFALLAGSFGGEATDSDTPGVITNVDRWFMALSILSGLALTITAAVSASALSQEGNTRYRLLAWAGGSLAVSYLFFPPLALYEAVAPAPLGEFWQAPVVFGSIVLGVMAGALLARAFAWSASKEGGPTRIPYADREFLLFVVALSLLLPRLVDLALTDWAAVLHPDASETTGNSTLEAVANAGMVLLIPMIFFVATAGFLVSSLQAGWRPRRWLQPGAAAVEAGPGAVPGKAPPAVREAVALPQAVPRAPATWRRLDWRGFALRWDRKMLLTWRLPVLYGWLVILIAICSFLRYWGFLAVVPAAAQYLAMWGWERRRPLT
jgi:hypothetical protein